MAGLGLALGIISIIIGILYVILGWLLPWIIFVGLIGGIVAIILGAVSKKNPAKKGVSIASLVLGIIGTVFCVISLIFCYGGNSAVNDLASGGDLSDYIDEDDLAELENSLNELANELENN